MRQRLARARAIGHQRRALKNSVLATGAAATPGLALFALGLARDAMWAIALGIVLAISAVVVQARRLVQRERALRTPLSDSQKSSLERRVSVRSGSQRYKLSRGSR